MFLIWILKQNQIQVLHVCFFKKSLLFFLTWPFPLNLWCPWDSYLCAKYRLKLINSWKRSKEADRKDAHELRHTQAFSGNKTAKRRSQMWAISSSGCFAMNGSQSSDCRVFLREYQHSSRRISSSYLVHNLEKLSATFIRIKGVS